jgi:hypothetical protein
MTIITGTVVMSFTGYGKDGTGYSGKLVVLVVDSPAGIVPMKRRSGRPSGSRAATSPRNSSPSRARWLSYVQFTLPPKDKGTLYSGYSSETGKGTAVTASTKYYNGSSPDISDIVFVPPAGFTGEVETGYTVCTASGTSFAGKLKFRSACRCDGRRRGDGTVPDQYQYSGNV